MTKYALLDKSGKTRLTTDAFNLSVAHVNFGINRGGNPIPEGWTIVKRNPKPRTPRKLEPGHLQMKMESGDVLEFWIEGARGCVFMKAGDAGGSKCIVGILASGLILRPTDADLKGLQTNKEGEVMM